jgi:hypothetical protein
MKLFRRGSGRQVGGIDDVIPVKRGSAEPKDAD